LKGLVERRKEGGVEKRREGREKYFFNLEREGR
jgi:Mn-dependent DtxR family transcriptional regulator